MESILKLKLIDLRCEWLIAILELVSASRRTVGNRNEFLAGRNAEYETKGERISLSIAGKRHTFSLNSQLYQTTSTSFLHPIHLFLPHYFLLVDQE